MNSSIARRLVELNRQFYTDFGENFSATRQRIQPGVRKILSTLAGTERILDLGCGNGELARKLAKTGFRGTYLGLDFSLPLLNAAESQPEGLSAIFREVDLTNWKVDDKPMSEAAPNLRPSSFDLVIAFAVIHHIPGVEARHNILLKVHGLLKAGGRFTHSNWQFLSSEKLKARIQPWESVNLSNADVDEGDYLLDWRGGGTGLRYVHHFSEQELTRLAAETGFRVDGMFLSDGEGGRLGLYQVWEAM